MAKRVYYQNHLKAVKNDVKGTWKVINSVLGRNSTKEVFKLSINGIDVKDKSRIATEFNSYFSKVPEKLVEKIEDCKWRKPFHRYLDNPNTRNFKLVPTQPKEILDILKLKKGG